LYCNRVALSLLLMCAPFLYAAFRDLYADMEHMRVVTSSAPLWWHHLYRDADSLNKFIIP